MSRAEMNVEELVRQAGHLAPGAGRWLLGQVAGMLAGGGPLRAFIDANTAKIRKKFLDAKGAEDKADMLAELRIAGRLLAAPGWGLVMEPGASGPGRSPDFHVRPAGLEGFYLEVKRVREPQAVLDAQAAVAHEAVPVYRLPYTQKESMKFSDLIARNLGQFRHGSANVLALVIDSSTHEPCELAEAIIDLGRRVGRKDDGYFHSKGLAGAEDFQARAATLSSVVVHTLWRSVLGPAENVCWANPDAAVPLDTAVLRHLRAM